MQPSSPRCTLGAHCVASDKQTAQERETSGDACSCEIAPAARLFVSLPASRVPSAPVPMTLPSSVPTPAVRGVYCLREPVNGLWAYYAITSWGEILHPPRPAELGLDTAFVVASLADELDAVDPERPRLRLIRSSDGDAASGAPGGLASSPLPPVSGCGRALDRA